jgi:hypothetical protein
MTYFWPLCDRGLFGERQNPGIHLLLATLRFANQNAGEEDEYAAEHDLDCG